MVVFEDGLAKKSDYRHFNVKEVLGNDDVGAMEEVVRRRLAYWSDEQGASKFRRAELIIGSQRTEIARYRPGEIGVAHGAVAGQCREPGVGRVAGKQTRATRIPVIARHAPLQGIDQPRQFLHREPERAGAGSSLPDAEDGDPGIGVPAQAHTPGAAAHVEEDLAEPGQWRCVRR